MNCTLYVSCLYEQHASDPQMRAVLAEYHACVLQLECSARAMRAVGAHALADSIQAKTHELVLDAEALARGDKPPH